ncbi:MAG: hypothetical protein JO101_08910 [Candidatus Eremiobacteraeota bacterium]|nr:hypothetical protein [Candidatus Eremiobacteraeota bacterium]MBV8355425.1 hypothetical protein [Candidatus Eremiobacteraeota bacterium]
MTTTCPKGATIGSKTWRSAALVAALLLISAPLGAQTERPQARDLPEGAPLPVALNSCAAVRVALTDSLSSASAKAGDLFHFKTLDPIAVDPTNIVAPNAGGLGVVSLAQHAAGQGKGGFLALDPRYITTDDGRQIPVLIDRAAQSLSGTGSSANIPGYAGIIPGIGIALGAYGFLHHGRDVTLSVGTPFRVFVGNLETISRCRA